MISRLLKMDRRLTLGIGDNREHCFYIPVGFHLMRLYIDEGFELEELVIYTFFLRVKGFYLKIFFLNIGNQKTTLLFRLWTRYLSLCSIRFLGIHS